MTKKEFIASIIRMITSENLDVKNSRNNWDKEYVKLFALLSLDKLISNNININRYDVSKVIYILYYHQ
jgi:hypothetical protein